MSFIELLSIFVGVGVGAGLVGSVVRVVQRGRRAHLPEH